MSGHSKWSSIKRKKGAADAKKGAVFTKLANAITLAAKEGGSDPESNFSLRLVVDRARSVNMPNTNVERAIKRGTGELAGQQAPEQVSYEAYGPGGVAILVNCLTDNKNRTVSEVRSLITKRGGSLAEAGAVAYLFRQRGLITLAAPASGADDLMLQAIEAGALDVSAEAGAVEVVTDKAQFAAVKTALETAGHSIDSAELADIAAAQVRVTEAATARSIVELVTELEGLDDVVSVATNAEIEPELVGAGDK